MWEGPLYFFGFTAHTSRTDPPTVIAMLTELFGAIDAVSQHHAVEKISTVGDSYCGAIFPAPREDELAENAVGNRCSHGVDFACRILDYADQNQMRIGVHVGDVTGGFVGCSPPKFDLFGPTVDHAHQMESSGAARMVHVSAAVLEVVGDAAQPIHATRTADGILCDGWSRFTETLDIFDDLDMCAVDDGTEHATVIVKAVVAFANRDMPHDVDSDSASSVSVDTAEGGLHFHLVLLQFNSKSTERRFQNSIRAKNVNDATAKILFLLFLMQQASALPLGCYDAFFNRVAYTAIGALGVGMYLFMQLLGTNHAWFGHATFICYNSIAVIAFLGLDGDCEGPRRVEYVGGIAHLYLLLAMVAPQFIFDVKLAWRVVQLMSTGVLGIILTAIRRNVMRDEVALVDVMIFLPCIGYFSLSYFAEWALRDTFVAVTQLERHLSKAKTRTARTAATAMDVMMPRFVTDRVVDAAKAKRDSRDAVNEFGGTDKQSVFSDSTGSMVNVDIDFDDINALWEFPHVVVLFATIRSVEGVPYGTVDKAIQDLERVMQRHEVLKVKTTGATMMCLAGIDAKTFRSDAVAVMIDAACDMRRLVLEPLVNKHTGLEYAIGINSGPCFGAVMGGNGAIFDVFGDTVNTASRMMSSAANGAIQISLAVHRSLPADPRRLKCVIEQLPPVDAKGKGVLDVWAIQDPQMQDSFRAAQSQLQSRSASILSASHLSPLMRSGFHEVPTD
jgi:class 3 adenylate cyclase